jgi:hypothetical protein
MIAVSFRNSEVSELVSRALERSLTRSQIGSGKEMLVSDHYEPGFKKQIIFGVRPACGNFSPIGKIDGSLVRFQDHPLTRNLHLKERAFERYDFPNEWNNLGYGKIETTPGALFALTDLNDSLYCGISESESECILWFNRPVGPLDGFDWRIVEDFISDYRHESLPTLPVLSEIPSGYRAAATFRIDCDEAIESGRPLFELYKKHGFPFTLAIKTEQEFTAGSMALIEEVLAAGGSILIHSHTHAPEWGEPSTRPGPKSRGDAYFEASTSLSVLRERMNQSVNSYAVSPFHQNPRAALPKLLKAGIDGFIGGIICNDPEYLMARGGAVPFCEGMVSHSEQCMFHGDCIHPIGDSLEVYFDALESAVRTETFFGYLDHPFSNYHYGWKSEEARIAAHERFLNRLATIPGLLKASSKETLDFMWDRANATLGLQNGGICLSPPAQRRSGFRLKARWRGMEVAE